MGAEGYKAQCQFERDVKVGDKCLASWTNSGNGYTTLVEVVSINQKSFGVKIVNGIKGYPAGWHLNIPNILNYKRWGWDNRLDRSVATGTPEGRQ